MNSWYLDGQLIETLPIDDRGAQYGDGLFETIAVRQGVPRFLPLHLERMNSGCERLGLTAPSTDAITDQLAAAIRSSKVETATAKIVITAGTGPRGYGRHANTQVNLRIGIFSPQHLPKDSYHFGVDVRICNMRLARQPQLAGIKSLNRLEQVLARAEWNDSSIFEGLMLDTDQRLICGTMSNVFIVHSNTVATPAITHCGVAGVMRRHIISLLDEADINCEVRDIASDELFAAQEVLLTNSQFGVLPVRRCGRYDWAVGAKTRQIMRLAAASGVDECSP